MRAQRRIVVVCAAVVLLACGVAAAAPSAPAGARADVLKAHWDTGKVPLQRVREAVRRAGYTEAEFNAFLRIVGLRGASQVEARLVFYRVVRLGNAPYVKMWLWNAAKPFVNNDGDHGPYQLLPQSRVAITSADPQRNHYRDVYAYRVVGRTLTLRAVSHADPTETKAQVRLGKILLLAFAAAPYTRIK